MCMTFGCNPQINSRHFFAVWTLSFLGLMHLDTGHLVNPTPPTVLPGSFFKFLRCFFKVAKCA